MHKKILIVFLFFFICSLKVNAQVQIQFELVSIDFEGNSSIPSSELEGVIASKETPNWFYKFLNSISSSIGRPPVYFDSLKIQDDLKSLFSYYRDNGFFEVKFSYEYKINKEDKEAELIYHITEGPTFKINTFKVTGLDELPPSLKEKVMNNVDVDSADNFSKEEIEKVRSPIRTILLDNGYMLVEPIPPDVLIDTLNDHVDVTIGYNTNKRYTISDIRLEKNGDGKDLIKDTLIKRLVNIKSGDLYSSEKINKGQVRLYRTNIFSSVLVNTITDDTSGNYVPLNIACDIGKLNELSPELIINNQESAFNVGLGLSFTNKNFLGDARNFTVSGSFAVQDVFNVDYSNLPNFVALNDTSIWGYLDGRVAFEQPFIFGKPIRTRLELYSTLNKQREYRSTTYGSKISMDFELPKFVYFNSFVAYYTVDRAKYVFHPAYIERLLANYVAQGNVTQEQADALVANLGSGNQRVFTSSVIGFELGANKTNDLLFPTNGYTFSLTGEEANLLPTLIDKVFNADLKAKSQFYRLITKATYYPKIYDSNTSAFGIKLKAGYIQTYRGPSTEIPLNYRFTAGGSNSVRGWRSRELIPYSSIDFSNINIQNFLDRFLKDIPIGGTLLLEGSIETRNRIAGPLGIAAFLDFGNTWDGYKKFRFDNIAVAAGFGLIFYSSFAPIRLDLGFKAYDPVTKEHFFQRYKNVHVFQNLLNIIEFHLGIGEAF